MCKTRTGYKYKGSLRTGPYDAAESMNLPTLAGLLGGDLVHRSDDTSVKFRRGVMGPVLVRDSVTRNCEHVRDATNPCGYLHDIQG